jgi:hypothetical protein
MRLGACGRVRLVGFGLCVVAVAGLSVALAGAAPAPPTGVNAIAGDREVLLVFDAPPTGVSIEVFRSAGAAPASSLSTSCSTASAGFALIATTGLSQYLDASVTDGVSYGYVLCSVDENHFPSSPVMVAGIVPSSAIASARPAPVSQLRARVVAIWPKAVPGPNFVVVSWPALTDPNAASIVIMRRAGSAPTSIADGSVIFDGGTADTTTVDHPPAGQDSFYAAFAVNGQGVASIAATASVLFNPPLRAPVDGQIVRGRPRFVWRPRRGSSYYNLQVFVGPCCRRRIVNTWPRHPSALGPSSIRGRFYTWYVFAHDRPGRSPKSFDLLGGQRYVGG